ncbi:uncharacterized protein LOC119385854 [Rhipicephalus sanguineus]|uniref:uncharacterized protein LOC119385854 n=1 Tax=Rhipicephalus sanguineus TaxID=34632 RepID=UPI0020C4F473|nr:uncharacterized protein LOC119385854 [Rhipicephalus sanguineus]
MAEFDSVENRTPAVPTRSVSDSQPFDELLPTSFLPDVNGTVNFSWKLMSATVPTAAPWALCPGVIRSVRLTANSLPISEPPRVPSMSDLDATNYLVWQPRSATATLGARTTGYNCQSGASHFGLDTASKMPRSQPMFFQTLIQSIQDARLLEKSSRQQSKSTEWKKARTYRLTASNFGTVVAREKWTPKGLQNVTSDKDLSRVRAVQYGISNERQAVRRYEAALRTVLHDVQTFHCGLVVSPTSPWLGASPDRIVWDPQENSHGIIEVKCPYSMKDMDEPTTEGSCLYKGTDNVFRLDRRHEYYYQLLGQMAICGLSWADFVVYSPQFLVVERIKYDDAAWQQCKVQLKNFYFSTLLPYFASRDHPLQPSNS